MQDVRPIGLVPGAQCCTLVYADMQGDSSVSCMLHAVSVPLPCADGASSGENAPHLLCLEPAVAAPLPMPALVLGGAQVDSNTFNAYTARGVCRVRYKAPATGGGGGGGVGGSSGNGGQAGGSNDSDLGTLELLGEDSALSSPSTLKNVAVITPTGGRRLAQACTLSGCVLDHLAALLRRAASGGIA